MCMVGMTNPISKNSAFPGNLNGVPSSHSSSPSSRAEKTQSSSPRVRTLVEQAVGSSHDIIEKLQQTLDLGKDSASQGPKVPGPAPPTQKRSYASAALEQKPSGSSSYAQRVRENLQERDKAGPVVEKPSGSLSYAQRVRENLQERGKAGPAKGPLVLSGKEASGQRTGGRLQSLKDSNLSQEAATQRRADAAQSSKNEARVSNEGRLQKNNERTPPRYLRDGIVPNPQAFWTHTARLGHVGKHGEGTVRSGLGIARSSVSQERPGFKDVINKDTYRHSKPESIQTVTAKSQNIKSAHPREIEVFDRLAETNEVNKTGISISELGELESMTPAPERTARNDVIEDPQGRRYNKIGTNFKPKPNPKSKEK